MTKYILISFFLVGTLFTSCTDTIEIVPDDAPALLTVDAWLDNRPNPQVLKLTRSQTYFQTAAPNGVTDAIVEVSDDQGNNFSFVHESEGDYIWNPTNEQPALGPVGTSFTLSIDLQGKLYTSSSTMLPTPQVDEIRQEFRDDELGSADGIYTEFIARDIPGLGNTYWIKTFKNDMFLNKPEEINIAYDAAFDAGAQIDGLIFIPPIREFTNPVSDPDDSVDLDPAPWSVGDRIRVEIHSINPAAFFFMEVMRDQILNGNNGIFASPLSNTRGNIKSESDNETVLGVFNIAAVSSLEETIK